MHKVILISIATSASVHMHYNKVSIIILSLCMYVAICYYNDKIKAVLLDTLGKFLSM